MTCNDQACAELLSHLNAEGRAQIEITVDEILDDMGGSTDELIESVAVTFVARAKSLKSKERAAVGLLLAAALRARMSGAKKRIN